MLYCSLYLTRKVVREMKFNFIDENNIEDDIKHIENSEGYYISKSGKVYTKLYDKWLLKKTYITAGYLYCKIKMNDGKMHSCRVHRLVAGAFLPNPNNYPIVEHIDNDKSNPCIENLKWSTVQANTKKAYDDGLAKNDKGYEDSQSHPVIMYDTETDKEIARYGSISIASEDTGIYKSTIARQCKYRKKPRLKYYFRYDEQYNQTTIESVV